MSWIKPNFLWMMYRCGWASKTDQEKVLAIWINKIDFETILREAAFSSFNQSPFMSYDDWKKELDTNYSPDMDLSGMVQTSDILYRLGLKLANGTNWPAWKAGSEFKAIRDKSIGQSSKR